MNCKAYDVNGPGLSVADLTDNIEAKTQADTFYDHGEKIRVKGSKIGLNSWKPGVKIQDMYRYGFKQHFNKTMPKWGIEFYSTASQMTPFDKVPCSLPKSTCTREKDDYFSRNAHYKRFIKDPYKYNNLEDWSKI